MRYTVIPDERSKKRLRRLPRRPLTELDLLKYVKLWNINKFRGIFSRNLLPKRIHKIEKGIINLDNDVGAGTHWVAYSKRNGFIKYFDSYGDLKPPVEVEKYLLSNGSGVIKYNYRRYQDLEKENCGHLCLMFLRGLILV